MKVISVENVSKRFVLANNRPRNLADAARSIFSRSPKEDFWALKDVSFEVEQGEAIGIIGHNGAGKSTMLKLLTQIMQPTSGRIRTRGRVSALIEVGAGFHPEMTGRENVYLNGSILGMTRREIDAKFDEIVAFAELEKFIDTPVKRYSSGMYARLGFAVAAHVDPEVLIVDEVLSVGDGAFQEKCMQHMSGLQAQGCTVVFVSHNMQAVTTLCNSVVLLARGAIVDKCTPPEAIRLYRLQQSSAVASSVAESKQADSTPCDAPADVESLCLQYPDSTPVTAGDPVEFRMDYRVNRPIPGLRLALRFLDKSNRLVARTAITDRFGSQLPAESCYLNVQVSSLPLVPGVYTVVPVITDMASNMVLEMHSKALEVLVQAPPGCSVDYNAGDYWGHAFLDADWFALKIGSESDVEAVCDAQER